MDTRIEVKNLRLVEGKGAKRGYCTAVINSVEVPGVVIYEGKFGIFPSFPSDIATDCNGRIKRNNEGKPIYFPRVRLPSSEDRKALEAAVRKAYEALKE